MKLKANIQLQQKDRSEIYETVNRFDLEWHSKFEILFLGKD